MDRRLIEDKLDALRRCVARVADKRPATIAALEADEDLQDILAVNLTRAVQLGVDVAAHLRLAAPGAARLQNFVSAPAGSRTGSQ